MIATISVDLESPKGSERVPEIDVRRDCIQVDHDAADKHLADVDQLIVNRIDLLSYIRKMFLEMRVRERQLAASLPAGQEGEAIPTPEDLMLKIEITGDLEILKLAIRKLEGSLTDAR